VREALQTLPIALKIETQTLTATLPYTHYEAVLDLVAQHEGIVIQEDFAVHVIMLIELPTSQLEQFRRSVRDTTSGKVEFVITEV
jgi:putative IMPACT (imprinted ancient) family translation regulator